MMFTIPEVFVDYPNPISVTHAFLHTSVTWQLNLSSRSICTPRSLTDAKECNVILLIFYCTLQNIFCEKYDLTYREFVCNSV